MEILNFKTAKLNSVVEGCLLIHDAKKGTTRNDKGFLAMKLSNGKEEIDAKKWDFDEELPSIGEVIYIKGQIQEFQNNLQLIIHKYRKAQDDEYNILDFMPSLPEKKALELKDEFINLKDSLGDNYRKFMEDLFFLNGIEERYFIAPAAKIHHHAYIGGLLEHSVNVCKKAVALAELSYLEINKDLLIVGSLLHDVGKTIAYEYNKPPIDVSTQGKILDHIVLGLNMINNAYENTENLLIEEDYIHLQHMIASHHGKLEWGSPILPKTIEAEILHTADYFDAIDFKYSAAIKETPEDRQWSDWVRGLGKEVWIR